MKAPHRHYRLGANDKKQGQTQKTISVGGGGWFK